ncbi:MAG TPA: hypothetical protein VEK56_02910 [Vicinamibacterales bacterium]|nr:hypothetical protein [Vicinamibacterales bacterium]
MHSSQWTFVRLCTVVVFVAFVASIHPQAASAQPQHQQPADPKQKPAAPPEHQHPMEPKQQPAEGHEAMPIEMTGPLGISMARDGSGTSWLPDTTPMYAIHRQAGEWNLMLHGNLFVQYINEGSDRGDDQFGSTNWAMGMAHRDLAGGPLTLRGMISLEPLTVGACGYPTLLATGEFCDREPIHDRQHPHDLFMEIAAQYQREINPGLAYTLYGALSGEPALGPVAFPHRISALPNPIAPISHHWLDSTHISFGVLTAGIYQHRWKLEGSVFNGREPDENRYNFDFDRLDSAAGRFWLLPNERWAFQVSAGHLNDAELHDVGGARIDVARITASATYHRASEPQRFLATTLAWGHNRVEGAGTSALLAESSFAIDERNAVFGRGEINQKTSEDLVIPAVGDDVFTIGKLQAGYVRQLRPFSSLVPGIGASFSFSFLPERLARFYDGRTSTGFAVFLSLRPTSMAAGMDHEHMGGNTKPSNSLALALSSRNSSSAVPLDAHDHD